MRIVRNSGSERVIDLIRSNLSPGARLDLVTPALSLFAFAALSKEVFGLTAARILLPPPDADLGVLGTESDRPARNQLQGRWLAKQLIRWIRGNAEIRRAAAGIPQGTVVVRSSIEEPLIVLLGSLGFSTDGLGLTPGNPLNLIQASETAVEASMLSQWFDAQWSALSSDSGAKSALISALEKLASHGDPLLVYILILHQLFANPGDELDEDKIVKSATGIRNTVVWKKLFKFQRDGVVGAIDKLNRFGGCIIADSVGLGKTFEALAIIKYHELRNDRVLVLVSEAPARQLDALQSQ